MALSDRTLRAYDRAMLERSTPIVIRQNHPSNSALPMDTKSAASARRRRHTALAARTLAARETTRETRGARLARRFPFVRARGSRAWIAGARHRREAHIGRSDGSDSAARRRRGSIGAPRGRRAIDRRADATRAIAGATRGGKRFARDRGSVRAIDASVDGRSSADEADGSAAVDFV